MAGRNLEQVRFKETATSEKVYASIKYDFGIIYSDEIYKKRIISLRPIPECY